MPLLQVHLFVAAEAAAGVLLHAAGRLIVCCLAQRSGL